MQVGEDWTAADEVGASLISQQALFHALCTTLEERGLLSPEDIDTIYHDATTTLEAAEKVEPTRVLRRARAILERTSKNRARRPRRTP